MNAVLNKTLYLAFFAASFTMAEEPEVELGAGPGKSLVVANCGSCHSLDYISMNSPILDRAGWEKSLKKMVDVMGAPVPERTSLSSSIIWFRLTASN